MFESIAARYSASSTVRQHDSPTTAAIDARHTLDGSTTGIVMNNIKASVRGDAPELRIGQPTVTHSQRGVPTWRLELWHEGLNKHRVISATDPDELQRKATLQATEWDNRWQPDPVARRRQGSSGSTIGGGPARDRSARKHVSAGVVVRPQRRLGDLEGQVSVPGTSPD